MLSENLKIKREEKGLSQMEIAKSVGVSQQAYCSFENGLKVPSLPVAVALAKELETSLDDLVK